MSTERTIATQTQLETVNFELGQLADNLFAHINTDLSDAHGWNLVFGPSNDGQGNNLSFYSDQSGNLVGSFQLSLVINGNRVFVPANITVLPGKPASTGTDVSATLDTQTGAGFSFWVTQFDDTLSGLVRTILESYLLPHTLTGYWEAHNGMVLVNPELAHFGVAGSGSNAGWYDSSAILVARASLKLSTDGLAIRIPCDPRLGGPPHPLSVTLVPLYINSNRTGNKQFHQQFPNGWTLTATAHGSGGPFIFQWFGRVYSKGTGASTVLLDQALEAPGQDLGIAPSSGRKPPSGGAIPTALNGFDTNFQWQTTLSGNVSTFHFDAIPGGLVTAHDYSDLKCQFWCKVTAVGTGEIVRSPFMVFESEE